MSSTSAIADAAADDSEPPSAVSSGFSSASCASSASSVFTVSAEPGNHSSYIIRAQNRQHFAQIAALFQEFADKHPQAIALSEICSSGTGEKAMQNTQDSLYRQYGASEHAAVFLLLVNGQPAGCCAVSPHLETVHRQACELHHLYVRQAYRGMGVGRQLCDAAIEFAALTPYHSMVLDTLNNREAVRSFYAELGFYEIPPFHNRTDCADGHFLKLELEI